MAKDIFRVEVGNATAESGWPKRFFTKLFFGPRYRFRITTTPVTVDPRDWGEPFELGIPEDDLELLAFRFPLLEDLEKFGEKLALFISQDTFIDLFGRSLTLVGQQGKPLRVMFSYQENAHRLVTSVPWECIFYDINPGYREHFGLSRDLSVARFISRGGADVYYPLNITDKLHVLGVAPNPRKCAKPLGVEAELTVMAEIANQYSEEIYFDPLPRARWNEFKDKLGGIKPHVLFFLGHSGFINRKPHLMFQKGDEDCDPISIHDFVDVLRPHRDTLRIVILAACGTGVAKHPFGSAAVELIKMGIPVVIAMQSKVNDFAATAFGLGFFNYLLQQKHSIDTCVNAGRARILIAERNHKLTKTQWAVPVLYLSTWSDQIFNFKKSSEIDSEKVIMQSSMEDKFPLPVEPFIQRPSLVRDLERDFKGTGLTVIVGPFGAGKTQSISEVCTRMIHSLSDAEHQPPLYFYIECKSDWTTFDHVLGALDEQTRNLGFQGFGAVRNQIQSHKGGNSINAFSELLAAHKLVIVLDDYIWDGAEFWRELFAHLKDHLRISKVYVITCTSEYKGYLGQYSVIQVPGFTSQEARDFFSAMRQGDDQQFDEKIVDEMMSVAASVGYNPWYVKIIKDVFNRDYEKLRAISPDTSLADLLIERTEEEVKAPGRAVLQQLAVLRQPITLQGLATMIESNAPSKYLNAAYVLQNMSLLTFTRNLGVELPKNLQEHYLSNMNGEERKACHERAADFYKRQVPAGLWKEQQCYESKFATDQ